MGLRRLAFAAAAVGVVACGSLLGTSNDDEAPTAPLSVTPDSAPAEVDASEVTPPVDAGPPDTSNVSDALEGKKIVFVSSTTIVPPFEKGADGANAFCDKLATEAGMPGRPFVAYLFLDNPLGGAHTGSTLVSEQGWFLRNGKKAFGAAILSPDGPIGVDEYGNDLNAAAGVWIGSAGGFLGTGLFGSNNCNQWLKTNGDTIVGDPLVPAKWRANGERLCNAPRHLYCFER